jgi:glycosyltransferase involved in cell wall biosynthesis
MCKVSVIVPTYNHVHYLADCLNSLASQSMDDFEVLVIDDASTDNTSEVIEAYKAHFGERLIYRRLESNVGRGAVRNYGIEIARGEYITFLDSDDAYLPEKVECQAKYLDEHQNAGAVTCSYAYVDKDMKRIGSNPGAPRGFVGLFGEEEGVFEDGTGFLMVRREILERTGLFDLRLSAGEDTDLIIRIASITKVGFIYEPLYLYRQHDSNTKSFKGLRDRTESNSILCRKIIDSNGPFGRARAQEFAYTRLARHVYRLRKERFLEPLGVWLYYYWKFRGDLPFGRWAGVLVKAVVGHRVPEALRRSGLLRAKEKRS